MLETFLGLNATGWTAIYTLITALALVIATVGAIFAGFQMKASRDAVTEARQTQAEENRPYVLLTVQPCTVNKRLFDLSIQNFGKRPAFDVRVEMTPTPERAYEIDGLEFANMKMLNEPISMLAPWQELRAFWDDHRDREGSKLPSTHNVILRYRDSSGMTYEEPSTIDIDALRGSAYANEKTVHHIAKHLESINETLSRSSLMSREGTINAHVVTETHSENNKRVRRERYQELISYKETISRRSVSGEEAIERIDDEITRLLEEDPGLASK